MVKILSCTRVDGRKYVVGDLPSGRFLRVNDSQTTQSFGLSGKTGLYYDVIADLLPRERDARILLLGVAGGTVARVYREIGGMGWIVGVDNDAEMIRLGKEFFNLGRYVEEVVLMNARTYLEYARERGLLFDAVVDDLWKDATRRIHVYSRDVLLTGGMLITHDTLGDIAVDRV